MKGTVGAKVDKEEWGNRRNDEETNETLLEKTQRTDENRTRLDFPPIAAPIRPVHQRNLHHLPLRLSWPGCGG